MSDNPVAALRGAIILIVLSFVALGARGSDALEICYNQVANTCSHAKNPIPCNNTGVSACDKSHPTSGPASSDDDPPPTKPRKNREIVLQGSQ